MPLGKYSLTRTWNTGLDLYPQWPNQDRSSTLHNDFRICIYILPMWSSYNTWLFKENQICFKNKQTHLYVSDICVRMKIWVVYVVYGSLANIFLHLCSNTIFRITCIIRIQAFIPPCFIIPGATTARYINWYSFSQWCLSHGKYMFIYINLCLYET